MQDYFGQRVRVLIPPSVYVCIVLCLTTTTTIESVSSTWQGKSGAWKGDFSVKSSRWTPSLREQLGYYITDDSTTTDGGVFWMTVEDWFYHFTSLYVCRTRNTNANNTNNTNTSSSSSSGGSNWTEIRVRAPMRNVGLGKPMSRPTLPCFRVEVLSDQTSLELSLHQPSTTNF